jgi:hypothetical protein
VSAIDIVGASGACMDCNIVGLQVEVVGTGELQHRRSCNKHHVCGSQLREGSCVFFRKTRFAWRGGEVEDVLEVFHLVSGIWAVRWGICQSIWPLKLIATMACVRALWRFTPVIAHVVIALAKCHKYHRGVGCCMAMIEGMHDMFVIA